MRSLFVKNDITQTTLLKNFLEKKYGGQATLVYKGREALRLALRLINQKGASVGICGFTCFAVYDAIIKEGYNVEYLDIEKNTLHFSYDTLRQAVEKNPQIKVVIVQNTLGYPFETPRLARFCQENKIILIEDLAHSIGAVHLSKQEAGTLGDFTILSFSQDKVIDGISGGALIVRNQNFQSAIANFPLQQILGKQQQTDRMYPLLTFLIRKTYALGIGKVLHAVCKKYNWLTNPMNDLTDIHALPAWYCSLIYAEFLALEKNLTHRRSIATIYYDKLKSRNLITIIDKPVATAACLRFPVFLSNRDSLIAHLKEKKIFISDIWYDSPIAPKQFLGLTNYQNQSPHAQEVCAVIINLPTHRNVSEKIAQKIISEINVWLELQ